MKHTDRLRSALYNSAALLLLSHTASAAPVHEVLDVDLAALIDRSAQHPTRFAVDVPHSISLGSGGSWTQIGTNSTWTYSIRIPTAVSMSFHASTVRLPVDAVLTVSGENGASITYRARDITRAGLWARPLAGESLVVSLSVRATERSLAALQIDSFQVGYRSLFRGGPENAHYRSITQSGAQTNSCTVNYSCDATDANDGPAHAIVAIVVSNVAQCTGTLLNDTSSDGAPYVLTARHCETGVLGGGKPGVAADVTVYWDAVAPCGATLDSIYGTNVITQTGATTVVEQQDAWLIRLDAPPAASDAYYAGWDATGGVFSGGYSIHHALGYDKQYVGWYGQAIQQNIPGDILKLNYTSTFWGVVNAVGNLGAGASGGALFDPNNYAVGSATLADRSDGANSAGVCPATPPPASSPATITAQYTALSAVFSSTADTTSSTGATTLQSVLDAKKTGQQVVSGMALLPVTLALDQSSPSTGQTLTLIWSAPGAQICTASGGDAGDGWSGTRSASGTYRLTEQTEGQVTYSIRCTAAGLVGAASVTATWQFVPASVSMNGPTVPVAAGGLAALQWAANAQPCTASGGISGDGWAGTKASSGSQSVQVSVLGNVTYTLKCGSGSRTATTQYSVTVIAPSVSPINGDANQLRVGQAVTLQLEAGGSCIASGGAAGDGWAGPLGKQTPAVGGGYSITETVAGTYTYTVKCSGVGPTAGLSATSSITLIFTSAPPTVTLSASPTPIEIYTDPGAQTSSLYLTWTANVRPCFITYVGPGTVHGAVLGLANGLPAGTDADGQQVAGSYIYTITCGTGQNQARASAPVTFFTNAPAVTLTVPNPWPLGMSWTVGWQTNVYPCTGTGGLTGDGWTGPKTGGLLGGQLVTESTLGTVAFGITCGSGSQIVQAQASTNVITPTASIRSNANTLPVGGDLVLNWTANFFPCTLSVAPGGTIGTLLNATEGFQTNQIVAGAYRYTISCGGAQASTAVTFTGTLLTFTANVRTVAVNEPVKLSWGSPPGSPLTAGGCMASGGSADDGWSGFLAGSGSETVTSTSAATVTYGIACDFGNGWSNAPQAQTQVTYTSVAASAPPIPTPAVTISANASTQLVGSSVTLSWSSQNVSACTATGGASEDGWNGSLPTSGTMSVTESTAGSFSYSIVCTGAPPAATAKADVEFTDSSVTVSSGGGKGGGGSLDILCLLVLGVSMRRHLRLAGRNDPRNQAGNIVREAAGNKIP